MSNIDLFASWFWIYLGLGLLLFGLFFLLDIVADRGLISLPTTVSIIFLLFLAGITIILGFILFIFLTIVLIGTELYHEVFRLSLWAATAIIVMIIYFIERKLPGGMRFLYNDFLQYLKEKEDTYRKD